MRRLLCLFLLASLAACYDGMEPLGVPEVSEQAVWVDATAVLAAMQVQDRVTDELMNRPGVVGVGTRLTPAGTLAIVVYAIDSGVAERARIPSHLDGVPVAVEVTGRFYTRDINNPTTRERPAPMGFSIGHPNITAGTLGARVKKQNGTVYILSNNHVIANSNNANVGDATLQPGPYDGGSNPADLIGTLADWQVILFDGSDNVMDAAIAQVNGADVDGFTPSYAYGAPSGNTKEAALNMAVQKFGRTTGLTKGTVAELNVTVTVCYAGFIFCTRSARFVNQIGISPGSFSSGGDSGSLIVTDDGAKDAVGLLFAGSSTRTLANPIGPVLTRFGVTIDPSGGNGGTPTQPDPDPPSPSFSLQVSAYKVRGQQKADLSWSGATSSQVDIHRDGEKLVTVPNSGSHTDNIDARGGGSYVYKVCEAGTSTCSNDATASF
jgi:hypothetical protein